MSAKRKALIVDDELDICELLEFFLIEHFDSKICVNPEAAIKDLENHNYDLVISDYRMSKISGFDILRQAHLTNENCKKVLITGAYLSEKDLIDNCPFPTQLIEKPFNDPESLVRTINSLFD